MMNETIKNLFVMSGGSVDGSLTHTDEGFDPEAFAKLVIQQCCTDMLQACDDKTLNQAPDIMTKLVKNVCIHFTDYLKTTYDMEETASW